MNALTIAQVLAAKPNGSFFTVKVQRPAKIRKGITDKIEKLSVFQGQACDYANRAPVKNAVASGTRNEPELPSHIQESFFIGDIRFWRGKSGKEYVPVCISGNQAKCQWLLNGKPVHIDAIKDKLLASEYTKKPDKAELEDDGKVQFCSITLDNVIEVR